MSAHTIISSLISRIKKEDFKLDERIPISYLIHFFIFKTISLINGFVRFRKVVFISTNVILRCKNKMKFGTNVCIDRGCFLDALSENGILLGNNVSMGKFTTIECTGSMKSLGKGIKVGNNVGLGTHGFLGCAGGIEIGNDVIIGNYVTMHSENHNYSQNSLPIRLQGVNRKGIKIGNDCWIGAKVTILDGAEIGNGCIIAAGAIVKGKFPPESIIGGIPARVIRSRF